MFGGYNIGVVSSSFKSEHEEDIEKLQDIEPPLYEQHDRAPTRSRTCPLCWFSSTLSSFFKKSKIFGCNAFILGAPFGRTGVRYGFGPATTALETASTQLRHQPEKGAAVDMMINRERTVIAHPNVRRTQKGGISAQKLPECSLAALAPSSKVGNPSTSICKRKSYSPPPNIHCCQVVDETIQPHVSTEIPISGRASVNGSSCKKVSKERSMEPVFQHGKKLRDEGGMIPAANDAVSISDQPVLEDVHLFPEAMTHEVETSAALDTMADRNVMNESTARHFTESLQGFKLGPSRGLQGLGANISRSLFGLQLRMLLFSEGNPKWFHIDFDVVPDGWMPLAPESSRINVLLGKKVWAAINMNGQKVNNEKAAGV